ncbi:MAG: putative oxidoreductase [Haloplasmataceae bacterium]|jgi:predicted aldo/keto reductase-like oxidoreductase|nr:putative oxidoreductase [Haloplasmataceae bacterium]
MKKIQIKNDVNNSLLGFGCMRFPTKHGKIDRELATKMLDYAYEHGLNHFDTAYSYHDGESELFLGEYLKKHDRKSFTLSTKLPVWKVKKYEDFEVFLDEQLNKLQVEYFDFYLLHALNKERWDIIVKNNVFKFIEEAKAKGKIRYCGFSYHDGKEPFKEIINSYEWDFCLLQINYIDFNIQQGAEGYDLAASKGIPVWVMEPLKGGNLVTLAEDIMNHYQKVNPNDSAAKWAFRWVHSLPNVKLILSGMSSLEQVEDNCAIFDDITPLNELELKIVDEVRVMINNRVKVACTGCRYCLPCPVGIEISKNFSIYNNSYMYNNKGSGKWQYNSNLKIEQRSYNCIECGQCLDQCPQKLPIPQLLKEVTAYFTE